MALPLRVESFSGFVTCALSMNCCRTIKMTCCWSTLLCCTAEGPNPVSLQHLDIERHLAPSAARSARMAGQQQLSRAVDIHLMTNMLDHPEAILEELPRRANLSVTRRQAKEEASLAHVEESKSNRQKGCDAGHKGGRSGGHPLHAGVEASLDPRHPVS